MCIRDRGEGVRSLDRAVTPSPQPSPLTGRGGAPASGQHRRHNRRAGLFRRCCRRAARLRPPDRLPYPCRGRRHVDAVDAEGLQRVDDGVDHRGWGADGAGFADALDPERIGLAGHFLELGVHVGHGVGARHAVVHEAAGEQLA